MFTMAVYCCSAVSAMAELKLGQNIHRKRVPAVNHRKGYQCWIWKTDQRRQFALGTESGKFVSTHQSLQTNLSGTQTPPSHAPFSSLADRGHLLPPSQSRPQKHGLSLMLRCQRPEGQNIHVIRGETESHYRRKVNERTASLVKQ